MGVGTWEYRASGGMETWKMMLETRYLPLRNRAAVRVRWEKSKPFTGACVTRPIEVVPIPGTVISNNTAAFGDSTGAWARGP